MMPILDGKEVSSLLKHQIRWAVENSSIRPTLATILVGDNPASHTYVRNKHKDCEECGFKSVPINLPADIDEEALIDEILCLSSDPTIHGILVQAPLPKHIDAERVIGAINPRKDVDCFTPLNVGLLYRDTPFLSPCTPKGVLALLKYYGIPIAGKHCVIIGRSNIVGKPMAAIMLKNNATVTICHSYTTDLPNFTRQADILISAVGKADFIQPEHIKEGCIVVDVGMNRNAEGKLCGDCNPAVYEKAATYTPVPGGVGPMTRAILMYNTALAAGLEVFI